MSQNKISIDELSKIIQRSKATIYALVAKGMPAYKHPLHGLRFIESEVMEWFDSQESRLDIKPKIVQATKPKTKSSEKHGEGFISFTAVFHGRSRTDKQPVVVLHDVSGSNGFNAKELTLDARTGRPFGNFLAQNPESGCKVKFVAKQIKDNVPRYITSVDIE